MHMKVFMSFTLRAIAKWISKIIYLWTVTFYLEKCSLWQVLRDEFQHSVFFSCLLFQILILYIIGKSKLIKQYTWELFLYCNNYFQHYKFTYFHVLTLQICFFVDLCQLQRWAISIFIETLKVEFAVILLPFTLIKCHTLKNSHTH